MPPKTQWVMQRMGSVLLCLFLNACEQVRFMKVFRITEYQSWNFKNIDKVWMGNSLLTLSLLQKLRSEEMRRGPEPSLCPHGAPSCADDTILGLTLPSQWTQGRAKLDIRNNFFSQEW